MSNKPTVEMVGRILLLDRNGRPKATVNYDVPVKLRDMEIVWQDAIYIQSRRDEHGRWVYRYDRGHGGTPTTKYVGEPLLPSDEAWDGPVDAPKPATFDDVRLALEKLMNASVLEDNKIPTLHVLRVYKMLDAARRGEPFIEETERKTRKTGK